MKKLLLLAGMVMAGGAVQAQITQERTYSSIVEPGKLSTGDVKYATYVYSTATTGQVRIYNLNHSVYRQVNVTVPSGALVDAITYVSDRLFNTNAGLEFVLNLRNVSTSVYNGMRIIDENGTVLLARDTTSYPLIYNTPNGTKMLVTYYNNGAGSSKIYALGGTLTALKVASSATAADALPYPNPTAANIQLPYTVAAGQVAHLIVRDATGRQVASYRVDNTFDHLLFSARGLSPGVYFYTVGDGPARRFAVQQ